MKLFFYVFLLFFLTLGMMQCASTMQNTSPSTRASNTPRATSSQSIDSQESDYSTINDSLTFNFVIDTIAQDSISLIDSLIEQARIDCTDSLFDTSHKLLTEAFDHIEKLTQDSVDLSDDRLNSYLLQIADLYSSYFPSHFLDSLNPSLANLVFRYQISNAIDTLAAQSTDSINILNNLSCENGAPYNVPIVNNKKVQNALLFITTKRRDMMSRFLSRASFYMPMMSKLFADAQLPTDLCFLPMVESGFSPRAYSYAHACGIWQFIPSTGSIFGLRINFWVDERRDPIASTHAAIKYLTKLNNDFHDWYLALASYNFGEMNVTRSIAACNSRDYWQLSLPNETKNYIPMFLAYVIIGKNPHCFGFDDYARDSFNLDTIHISRCINLDKIANKLNISLSSLKEINPHILQWCTPPSTNEVTLYLPQGTAQDIRTFVNSITHEDKIEWISYVVRRGDNLNSISKKFSMQPQVIKSFNHLRSNHVNKGRVLRIPVGSAPRSYEQYAVNNTKESQKTLTLSKQEPQQTSQARNYSNKEQYPEKAITKYKISKGDKLIDIANLFNVSMDQLCAWNNLKNPNDIKYGMIIKVRNPIKDSKIQQTSEGDKHVRPSSIKSSITPRFIYTVRNGDNLYTIARKLNISVQNLAQWNRKNIRKPVIYPGERLIYYKSNARLSTQISSPASKHSASETKQELSHYTIKKGDTLFSLSMQFNVDVRKIYNVNKLSASSVIKPGDRIKIPN